MKRWIGVENFAKIESAKICIDDYTLLVGQNNSGKTFMMQLIQGLSRRILPSMDRNILDKLVFSRNSDYSIYRLDNHNISEIIKIINDDLKIYKDEIISEIFRKKIPIEKLFVDIQFDEDELYEIHEIYSDDQTKKYNILNDIIILNANKQRIDNLVKNENIVVLNRLGVTPQTKLTISSLSDKKIEGMAYDALKNVFSSQSLFMPASRTGLMLLYRDFFANRTDESISYKVRKFDKIGDSDHNSNFTKPVYEFLRFLQTYSENDKLMERYGAELSFFDDRLIEGHISRGERGELTYYPKDIHQDVPLYLASSMINEIAPIEMALTSGAYYNRLIIDEVEASLHPEKQMELVRFLNRISNRGYDLIISTHSDSFASRWNNLYILSCKNDIDSLQQLGLEKEDIIDYNKMHVYDFVNQSNGKSLVKEVKSTKKDGFQFDLFTNSAMNLYKEAMNIGVINNRDDD